MAIARIGKNTGPRSDRITASSSASTRMMGSAIRKYAMFRRNARAMSGNEWRNSSPLKNACLNAGQFGECRMKKTISETTTSVLIVAIATPRLPSARRAPEDLRPAALGVEPWIAGLEVGEPRPPARARHVSVSATA